MKIFLNGWFRLTTPRIVSPTTLTTPTGRERQRYARLISGFTLFLLLLTLLTIPLRLFNQDISRASIG
ncbi:MAG TPA: hypothetical protein DHW02_02955, partial [Ktedonobacter sp.]|nr:hypothetical protein [Ktedonobacter sp.]